MLNRWYLEKAANNPRLHFLTESNPYDPRAQAEDLGDNSMLASEYGIKNLQRILPNAAVWTKEEAQTFERAQELYDNVVGQFNRYIGHVTKWVGGVYETPKTYDQSGAVYEVAPTERQREAVAFLHKHLFQTPEWLFEPKVLRLLRPESGVTALMRLQENTLNSLFSPTRLQRMIENEALDPQNYTIAQLFDDLRTGIWSELPARSAVSLQRRNLQKMFIDKMSALAQSYYSPIGLIQTPNLNYSDVPSLALATLRQLQGDLNAASNAINDATTRHHYNDCLRRIESALDIAKRR